jgi:hypothetical protein
MALSGSLVALIPSKIKSDKGLGISPDKAIKAKLRLTGFPLFAFSELTLHQQSITFPADLLHSPPWQISQGLHGFTKTITRLAILSVFRI